MTLPPVRYPVVDGAETTFTRLARELRLPRAVVARRYHRLRAAGVAPTRERLRAPDLRRVGLREARRPLWVRLRDEDLWQRVQSGESMASAGRRYGLTRARVSQIIDAERLRRSRAPL